MSLTIILELQVLELTEEMYSCVPSGSFLPHAITLDGIMNA